MRQVVGILNLVLYAAFTGFILYMLYRIVRAFERIAKKLEDGIMIKEKKEGIVE